MDMTRKGSSRTVVLVGKYAIKIPRMNTWETFLRGLLSNYQEVRFSKLKYPYLCPILFYLPGGFMTIMPRCDILETRHMSRQQLLLLLKSEERAGRCMPVEPKHDSFGLLPNGRLVAVDYG